jgi:hypothetical protein
VAGISITAASQKTLGNEASLTGDSRKRNLREVSTVAQFLTILNSSIPKSKLQVEDKEGR